ncbi:AraC family transcriptional regulator [Mycolicibacterium austroafricanum]|uniref:AraC family transcriptional regulator n=1 Tax=Mycolicibacterium austroafricanum TaxID=39687 RepID=UPI000A4072E1|nr:AraC family transcriptional regulator [Mycolicibacterium austroafricanum]QZY47050.1 AraC family transcriptional regulator [Mycolicibacterium austroafricanum]
MSVEFADTRRRVSIRSRDVDESRAVGARVFYPHSVAVLGATSRFALQIDGVDLGAVTLGWLSWGTEVQIGTAALDDAYQVNIPMRGRLETSCGTDRVVATPSRAAVYRHDRQTMMRGFGDGRDWVLAVKIDRTSAERHLAKMLNRHTVEPIQFDMAIDLTEPRCAQWWSMLRDLAVQVHRPESICLHPLMAESLSASIMTGLMLAARHNYTDALHVDSSAVRAPTIQRAVDYIEDNLGEPLDVTSIAAHARLSVRALQEGFRATFGTTPMRYVRQARLRQARDDLRCATGDEGVTQIAHRWGFTHLGRFACLYRQTFGESPSAALNTGVRRYGTRSPIHATDECADATLS